MTAARAVAVGAAAFGVGLAIVGLQAPLFAQLGYEFALVAGLTGPALVASLSARDLFQRALDPLQALFRGAEIATVVVAAGYLAGLLSGLRSGHCDLVQGSLWYFLGPGIGMFLAGFWGALACELARRFGRGRGVATLLALGGPLASAGLQLGLFYATPVVFAYDPFVGHFSGALYDTVIEQRGLLSYRAASAATLLACCLLAFHLRRDEEGRLAWRRRGQMGLLLLGLAAALASAGSVALGSQLGHWQSAESIAGQLGAQINFGRCRVIYDRRLDSRQVTRLARDCEAHVEELSGWLTIDAQLPVTVYLFRDTSQKRALMGAAGTSVAKPWRREIYLQERAYPHPVLRHELVHILAGQLARGPFAVAGHYGGWLPSPGLVEGIAVAAAPRDDNLSQHDWAAAMRKIDVLPRLDKLFGLSFFGQHSSVGYTAAGSFVDYVRRMFGAKTIARWYGGESLEDLTGSGLVALEKGWWKELDLRPLEPAALAVAEARFKRPSLFARRCPHVVDALLRDGSRALQSGDAAGALATFERVLRLSPGDRRARLGMPACRDRLQRRQEGLDELKALSEDGAFSEVVRMQAAERRADLLLREGAGPQVRKLYGEVVASATDEGRLRTVDLKSHYAGKTLPRQALVALLIGTDSRGPNVVEALDLISQWRVEAPRDGVPDYLLARQYMQAGRYRLASARLDAALVKKIALVRVTKEAWRLKLVVACALGDAAASERALRAYRAQPGLSKHRLALASALRSRCVRAASTRAASSDEK